MGFLFFINTYAYIGFKFELSSELTKIKLLSYIIWYGRNSFDTSFLIRKKLVSLNSCLRLSFHTTYPPDIILWSLFHTLTYFHRVLSCKMFFPAVDAILWEIAIIKNDCCNILLWILQSTALDQHNLLIVARNTIIKGSFIYTCVHFVNTEKYMEVSCLLLFTRVNFYTNVTC